MNPFNESPLQMSKCFQTWKQLYPKPYDKHSIDPYTKTRIILMNGTEFESNWFSHQFSRHVSDNDLRRELAMSREIEKQQQIKLSLLKPANESYLEHTIAYEQLAVDLTAELAKRECDFYVKKALDFALLEDFDHLYRYSDHLESEQGIIAENLVGKYTEIMPGRPTIAHYRMPKDNVRRHVNSKTVSKQTMLSTMIITAAEQQTMNYYMNVTNLTIDEMSRKLYREIALVEEEHVTQYEDLMAPNATWLEMLLWHEYNECYLYWSCYQTETDDYVKSIWEENLAMEITHLHKAAEMLKKYEGKDWQQVIPDGDFPAPISLHENIDYVREILRDTVQFTSVLEDYQKVDLLSSDADLFRFQKLLGCDSEEMASHNVIEAHIKRFGQDYRYEREKNPIERLQNRTKDDATVGLEAGAAQCSDFTPNQCN